jgi:hypothetical protein
MDAAPPLNLNLSQMDRAQNRPFTPFIVSSSFVRANANSSNIVLIDQYDSSFFEHSFEFT